MKRLVLALGLVAVAAVCAACSCAPAAQPLPSGPVDPNGPTIVAKDMKFTTSAGRGQGRHRTSRSTSTTRTRRRTTSRSTPTAAPRRVSVGQIVTSAKADQVVPALQAGTYFFRCDVHHDMTGTIVAK